MCDLAMSVTSASSIMNNFALIGVNQYINSNVANIVSVSCFPKGFTSHWWLANSNVFLVKLTDNPYSNKLKYKAGLKIVFNNKNNNNTVVVVIKLNDIVIPLSRPLPQSNIIILQLLARGHKCFWNLDANLREEYHVNRNYSLFSAFSFGLALDLLRDFIFVTSTKLRTGLYIWRVQVKRSHHYTKYIDTYLYQEIIFQTTKGFSFSSCILFPILNTTTLKTLT